MANSKNTIQNIPLTGNLCLNTLKTDVTQFTDYNEKNSTVFGGELSPIWTKETELGNKNNTYTIFNSKGKPFTIDGIQSYPKLKDKDGNELGQIYAPYIVDKPVPEEAYWYTILNYQGSLFQIYLTSNGDLYGRVGQPHELENLDYTLLHSFNVSLSTRLVSIDALFSRYSEWNHAQLNVSLVASNYSDSDLRLYYYSLYDFTVNVQPVEIDLNKYISDSILLSGTSILGKYSKTTFTTIAHTQDSNKVMIQAIPFSGQMVADSHYSKVKMVTLTPVENGAPTVATEDKRYFFNSEYGVSDTDQENGWGTDVNYIWTPPSGVGDGIINVPLSEFELKTVEITPVSSYLVFQKIQSSNVILLLLSCFYYYTGHDGNYFIPGVKPTSFESTTGASYINGTLFTFPLFGRLVALPGQIAAPFYHIKNGYITYKGQDEKWYTFSSTSLLSDYRIPLSRLVIDNRYIPLSWYDMFDIETETKVRTRLGYIDTITPVVPYSSSYTPSETTTMICASGYNVNYPISKKPFTSMLLNPRVFVDVPKDFIGFLYTGTNYPQERYFKNNNLELFYSVGDNVQSAEYQGENPEYFGTVYPIDVNGNIIYPITWNSQIINGYSNNDLVKEGNTAYPLIYWNNNQKMYSYYLLSSMEGITGAFALQGQQYTLDDNNIYNVQFSNGVIQNVTTVAYKKNMQFLGTLPTSAIFYSKYNKTFYQFTGDSVLTKLFEASDINEITMTGQNPSTLSIWVCTDNGVYILSDTDMFKLDYDVNDIYFNEEKTILVTEGETNWTENDISLYDIGNEATENPIKLQTKYYGLGSELKANYDCWYIRLHNRGHKAGKLKVKVNTITDVSFQTEEKVYNIEPGMYDSNDTIYIRYQPKYQTAVATQLELESDIAIYQISLGVNQTDAVAQQSKFNF